MKGPARLQAARHWIDAFDGRNVVRGYAKWFGVDLGCAVKELRAIGIELDPLYVQALATTLQNPRSRRKTAEPSVNSVPEGYGWEWDDDLAYIAGFTPGGAPFGGTWTDC